MNKEEQQLPDNNPARADLVQQVFEFWRIRMGHPKARLDQKRKQKIRQRLCDGYEVSDLIDAVDGCALSDFHMGKNDRGQVYNDIELICRDASHVDRFMALKASVTAKRAQSLHQAKMQRDHDERQRKERDDRYRARKANVTPIFKEAT